MPFRTPGALVLIVVMLLANTIAVFAGPQHARAVIGLGIQDRLAGHNGVAHAERHQGSKYRIAHEELGNNYTYGNAGSGHAHHHGPNHHASGGSVISDVDQDVSIRPREEMPQPVLGSQGTSQFVKQTWLAGAAGKIIVAWSKDSFLQIDPAELKPGSLIVARASLKTQDLAGTVELSARLDRNRKPQIASQLTGIFKGMKIDLVTHANGVVSLQFRDPLSWAVPGKMQTFDIALDASIGDTNIGRLP